ncbi:MAG: adaptor protein MecA, partial [Lachnospiraceae bacterium]|nr:adaptor protein MecA [Lachnospiraceae bacterium]
MRFQKISDNSIRCIITQEEMIEKGVKIDDLMDNREKAEDFLRYILQEARYAVDFRTNGNVLNVQLSMMPGGDISLMISDDEDSAIRNVIAEMKNHMAALQAGNQASQDSETPLASAGPGKNAEGSDQKGDPTMLHASSDSGQMEEDPNEILDLPIWAQLDSLEDCIQLSVHLTEISDEDSTLYYYEGLYFLEIRLKMTRKKLAGIAFRVVEHADGLYADVP